MNFLRVTLIFIILITCNIIFFTCSAFTHGSFAEIHMERNIFFFRSCCCFLFLSTIDIFTSILMFVVVVMAIIRKLVCNILAPKKDTGARLLLRSVLVDDFSTVCSHLKPHIKYSLYLPLPHTDTTTCNAIKLVS